MTIAALDQLRAVGSNITCSSSTAAVGANPPELLRHAPASSSINMNVTVKLRLIWSHYRNSNGKAAEFVAAAATGPAAAVEMCCRVISFDVQLQHGQQLQTDYVHQLAALCVQLTNATLYAGW